MYKIFKILEKFKEDGIMSVSEIDKIIFRTRWIDPNSTRQDYIVS